MAAAMGPHCYLVEFGSGGSHKTQILLRALDRSAAYLPVDISGEHLLDAAIRIRADFPLLPVIPICADYTAPFRLQPLSGRGGNTVGFFPGTTIGNFEPAVAQHFLAACSHVLGAGSEMIIGVDLHST